MLRIREAQTPDDLMKNLDDLDAQSLTRALDILEELRVRVLAQIAAQPTLTASTLPGLLRDIDQLIQRYTTQLTAEIHSHQAKVFDLSDDVVDAHVRAAGLNVGIVGVSDTVLRLAQAHTASEITNVTTEQRTKINRELHQAVLGGRTYPELIKNIGGQLGDKSVFKSLETRVEIVVRTESANIFNWGFQARGNQVAEQLPGMQKMWVHRHGVFPVGLRPKGGRKYQYTPRPAHLALDGKTIPWEEKFDVNGYEAHGPHDPTLPAGEVIACGCRLSMDLSKVENPLYRINPIGAINAPA